MKKIEFFGFLTYPEGKTDKNFLLKTCHWQIFSNIHGANEVIAPAPAAIKNHKKTKIFTQKSFVKILLVVVDIFHFLNGCKIYCIFTKIQEKMRKKCEKCTHKNKQITKAQKIKINLYFLLPSRQDREFENQGKI